jgi:GST-like protein
VPWKRQQQDLEEFPSLKRWFEHIAKRPATLRAYAKAEAYADRPTMTEQSKKLLFGQTAASVNRR